MSKETSQPVMEYSKWRHGGWYVHNVVYPSGAIGCVSRNYPDKKWRIVCDERPDAPTFKCRDDAARAELLMIAQFGSTAGADAMCSCGHKSSGHLFFEDSSACVHRPCTCQRFDRVTR